MDSGPLIPVNGQVLREVQVDHPIELNRQLGPSAYLHVTRAGFRPARISSGSDQAQMGGRSELGRDLSLGAIATLRSTPIYEAVGSIAINKMDPALTNLKIPVAAVRTTTTPATSTPKSGFCAVTCLPSRSSSS